MKTIGLLGGMSWESTQHYYQLLNEGIKTNLGGLHSAKVLLASFDFSEIEKLQHTGSWGELTNMLIHEAKKLESIGAEGIAICTNTMHLMAEDIQNSISIPLIHIADGTGAALQSNNIGTVGFLGTRFTMEKPFYRERIESNFGCQVITPNDEQRTVIHNIIYNELCLGKVVSASQEAYIQIIESLKGQGCEGIILGCTEIGMLINESNSPLPVFDTTHIHAESIVDWMTS